jgi:hypothetical protein
MNTDRAGRLNTTPADQDNEAQARGRREGMAWALDYATLEELRDLVDNFEPGRSPEFDANHSVSRFINGKNHRAASSVPHYDNPFWRGFAAGAQEMLDDLYPPG